MARTLMARLLFLVTETILFNFERTQYKNQFDANLVNIRLAVIERLSISCFVLFLVTADGGHLGMPNCKKSKWFYAIIILAQSWINFKQGFLRYCHFHVNAIFGTSSRPDSVLQF